MKSAQFTVAAVLFIDLPDRKDKDSPGIKVVYHDVEKSHSRPQGPRSSPRIATSDLVQHRNNSSIHGLLITLRKSDKCDWLRFETITLRMISKLELARSFPEVAILVADQKERRL